MGERGRVVSCQFYTGSWMYVCVCVCVCVCVSYLLRIVGHVWKHGGNVKHDLIVLIGCIQGVCSS